MSSKNKPISKKPLSKPSSSLLNRYSTKESQGKQATSLEQPKHKPSFPVSRRFVGKSVSPSKRKLEEDKIQIRMTKEPPPKDDVNSFLDLLSDIIQKHLEEENLVELATFNNEKQVEQSRRAAQTINEDSNPLLNQTLNDDSLYLADLENHNEKEILDFTYDFDPIVLETIDDLSPTKESNVFSKTNNPDDAHTHSQSPDKDPEKDYSSWLIFDTDGEFVKFKDECDLIEREPILDEATHGFFSNIEQSIRQYENMDPAFVQKDADAIEVEKRTKGKNKLDDSDSFLQEIKVNTARKTDDNKFQDKPHKIISETNVKDDRVKKTSLSPKNDSTTTVDLKSQDVVNKIKTIRKADKSTTLLKKRLGDNERH